MLLSLRPSLSILVYYIAWWVLLSCLCRFASIIAWYSLTRSPLVYHTIHSLIVSYRPLYSRTSSSSIASPFPRVAPICYSPLVSSLLLPSLLLSHLPSYSTRFHTDCITTYLIRCSSHLSPSTRLFPTRLISCIVVSIRLSHCRMLYSLI